MSDPTDAGSVAGQVIAHTSRVLSKVYKQIKTEFEVLSQEVVVHCPDNIQRYHAALQIRSGSLPKKIAFGHGKPLRVAFRPVRSLEDLSSLTTITENGFFINTTGTRGEETYLLDVEYEVQDPRFLDSLVERNVAKEQPWPERSEYWMQAQMKSLKAIKREYGRFDLRDVDFSVDVGIHKQISQTIPSLFRQEIETIVEWVRETEREKKSKLSRRHMQLQRRRASGGGDAVEVLRSIQDLFSPSHFRGFVEVLRDFNYETCLRGPDFYDGLPIPTWPKHMKVVSRTDLSFAKPAAEGVLVYKRAKFEEALEGAFG